jgi:hypothetical protein
MNGIQRAKKLRAGKLWQVYLDSNPENVLIEGSKSFCLKLMRERNMMRSYKRGETRLGLLIQDFQI